MADYFEEARQTDTTMTVTTANTTPETTALTAPSTEGPTIMAYPPGVSLATITIGAGRTMFGAAPKLISATVTPIFVGTPHVVHAASGWAFYPSPQTFRVENGEELSFELPHVNAEGWRDTAGNEFPALLESGERDRGWAYHAKFTVIGGSGQDAIPHRYEKVFQPLVGQTEPLDLDLVPDGRFGEPVTAPAAQVSSVAGLTGVVTEEQLQALGLGIPLEDVQAVADAAGDQAVIDSGLYTDERIGNLSDEALPRVSALEEGRVVPEENLPGWLTARIANTAAGGVVDLMGRDITVTSTITLSKALTLRNGTIRGSGVRPLVVDAAGVRLERMSFHSTGAALSAVSIRGERFLSKDCHYTAAMSSALTFTHGVCNGSVVLGGTCTSFDRRQNSAGIYVGAGQVGNYDVTIDGVTVIGGPDRGPDGIIVYDSAGATIRNCTIKHIRALPDVPVTGWTLTAVPNVWVSTSVRPDGPTRALWDNTGEWTETAFATDYTQPSPKTWTTTDNLVYLNVANADGTGGFDPNTRTWTSKIVSGYAVTMYCTPGTWRTMRDNLVSHNHIEDVDGYGIYYQLGDAVATGNATDSNTLINTCLRGEQSTKLPFAAIGVVGGKQTTLSNDSIDGAVANGVKVSSTYLDPANYSTGSIVGLRVRAVTGNGVFIGGGNWQIVNTNVTECTSNGFHLFPEQTTGTVGASLVNCEGSFNAVHGINATAAASANLTVNIIGGFYRKNTSRGMNAHNVDTLTVGGGSIFDGNPGYNLNVSDGCVNVHLDGVLFQNANGLSVGNGVTKLTTGRLIWGNGVSTKVAGTGAARVVDVYDTPIATSPDGTRYKLAVPNGGGAVTATAL